MRSLILSTIVGLAFLACSGALEVPGDAPTCEVIELRQSPINPCAYELPAGACGELTVYMDGELQPGSTLKVFCHEGVVFVPSDAHGLCPLREVVLCSD